MISHGCSLQGLLFVVVSFWWIWGFCDFFCLFVFLLVCVFVHFKLTPKKNEGTFYVLNCYYNQVIFSTEKY